MIQNKHMKSRSIGDSKRKTQYSISLLKNILVEIKPKISDSLYDISSPLYNIQDKPHYESANANFWLKLVTRYSLSGDTKALHKGLTKKKFYNGWLLLMQNDLLKKEGDSWVINTESKFHKYHKMLFTNGNPLEPIVFSSDSEIQSADQSIIGNLDIILPDILSYPGFASLFLGFMTFTEFSTNNFNIDFVLHGRQSQATLNKKFGIIDFSHGYLRVLRVGELPLFFTDILINGFAHDINGENNLIRPDPDAFLNEYFELYQPVEPIDFEEAVSIFTEDTSFRLETSSKNKRSFIGLDNLYNFLVDKVDKILDVIFSPYGEYTMYEQFLDDPNYFRLNLDKK